MNGTTSNLRIITNIKYAFMRLVTICGVPTITAIVNTDIYLYNKIYLKNVKIMYNNNMQL